MLKLAHAQQCESLPVGILDALSLAQNRISTAQLEQVVTLPLRLAAPAVSIVATFIHAFACVKGTTRKAINSTIVAPVVLNTHDGVQAVALPV